MIVILSKLNSVICVFKKCYKWGNNKSLVLPGIHTLCSQCRPKMYYELYRVVFNQLVEHTGCKKLEDNMKAKSWSFLTWYNTLDKNKPFEVKDDKDSLLSCVFTNTLCLTCKALFPNA